MFVPDPARCHHSKKTRLAPRQRDTDPFIDGAMRAFLARRIAF